MAYDILEIRDFGLRHLGITTFWIRRFGITTFRIRRFGYFILDTTFWNTTFSPDTDLAALAFSGVRQAKIQAAVKNKIVNIPLIIFPYYR